MSAECSLTANVRVVRQRGGFDLDAAVEVPPGITVLFGPSGSGKSTLLAAIAGLVQPNDGRIALGAEVWFDAKTKQRCPIEKRRIAFVFQSLALFPHLTAQHNVEYGIDRALSSAERHRRAASSLERFQVSHLAARKPPTFSGGEAQRVALARAMAMSPRVILLDEPFSAMDRKLRQELAMHLRGVADDLAVPILHVTHHRSEARAIGDRVILMRSGRVEASGSVDKLLPARDHDDAAPDSGHAFADTPMPRAGRSSD
jgi:ABC-type sulfate/molybdate transport systems ATPase subunit